jgi:hypothetical protein
MTTDGDVLRVMLREQAPRTLGPSEVAASVGPFVVLLGQDRADQADDRSAVGEDPDNVPDSP